MQKWFIGIGILAIALTIIYQPTFGFALQRLLSGSAQSKYNGISTELAAQVVSLKGELAQSIEAAKRANSWPPSSEPAFVYSRYPFNFKSEFVITVGKDRGIAIGMPVVLPVQNVAGEKPVIVGKIVNVYEHSALVRTLFDPSFQMPVRIGSQGVDALFIGGPEPKLTLIPKHGDINDADPVYSASPDFPYGLTLGSASAVVLGPNQVFRESILKFPYDLNDIKMVAVMTGKR